ncbi:MAG: toprim domain-containing protein [Thermoplasmata archaeon]|nr:toprim domain-containing protein [Thermoplasmata archaeon]MCI4355250.1 toprim domain-containing protein [Thermoplasmata archaeon]
MAAVSGRQSVWPEFLKLWSELLDASRSPDTVIVVEGERDRTALARLGIEGRVRLLHRGRPLSGTAHELVREAKRVIVLTDWDSEGGQLAKRLREFLEAEPVLLDLDFRRRLARVLRGELVHVEGIAGWARRTAEQLHVPLDQWLAEIDSELARKRGPTG